METLPDDIWYDILRMGIETGRLGHTDLCSLAIVNHHFDRLTMHSSHWADLISRDFPRCFSLQAPSKYLYRKKHEINRFDHLSYQCILFSPEAIALPDPLSERTEEDSLHQIIKRMHQINLDNIECLPSVARYCIAQRINDTDYREGFVRLSCMNLKENPMARVPLPCSNVLRSTRGYESDNVDSADGTADDVPSSDHQQAPSLESYVGRPVTRRERKRSYENKPSKSSRPVKVIPNSRSYVPMNRPSRRSMPRKI